jgi:hypothetical protein
MHLIHAHHADATANLALVTRADLIAFAIATLVSVVEEWRAVALVSSPEAEKLNSRHLPAELIADLGSHGFTVGLWDMIVVPDLLFRLRVEHAPDKVPSGRAPLRANSVRFRKITWFDRMDQRIQACAVDPIAGTVHLEAKFVAICLTMEA